MHILIYLEVTQLGYRHGMPRMAAQTAHGVRQVQVAANTPREPNCVTSIIKYIKIAKILLHKNYLYALSNSQKAGNTMIILSKKISKHPTPHALHSFKTSFTCVKRSSTSGFSLLEVLVALVIIAIAIGTSLHAAQERTTMLEALRERIVARWVAHNIVADIQKNPREYEAERSGQNLQAGINFVWISTPDAENAAYKMLPIHVAVKNNQGTRLSEAFAWISSGSDVQETQQLPQAKASDSLSQNPASTP